MSHTDWKQKAGQQLQVANQHIVSCQKKIQQAGDNPDEQLCLQKALGGIARAWQEIESTTNF